MATPEQSPHYDPDDDDKVLLSPDLRVREEESQPAPYSHGSEGVSGGGGGSRDEGIRPSGSWYHPEGGGHKKLDDIATHLRSGEETAGGMGIGGLHGGKEGLKEIAKEGLFNPEEGGIKGLQKVKQTFFGTKERRNRTLFGGGIVGGIISVFALLFFALLPYKISLMVEHLQNRFFGASEAAISQESQSMFDTYLKKHVFPGLGPHCPTTRADRSCAVNVTGDGPIMTAYQQWHTKNIQNKWAEKYGIEFGRRGVGSTSRIYMRAPGLNGGEIDLPDDVVNGSRSIFDMPEVSHSQARQALRDAIAGESRWKQVFLRFQMRRIADANGIRRCIIACNLKDKWSDSVVNKKRAATLFIAQRVLQPHSAALALAVQCIMDGGCDPNRLDNTDGPNGARQSEYDRQLSDTMRQFAARYGEDSLQAVLSQVSDILDKGFFKYATDSLIGGIAGKFGASAEATQLSQDVAGKAVPFVGWANLAAETVGALSHLGPKVRKLTYATNVVGMIGMWTTYRSVASEIQSGHVDPTELGSFQDSLAPSSNGPGAEASPLYANTFDSDSKGAAAILNTFLPAKAYADTQDIINSQKQLNSCDGEDSGDNQRSVPAGKLICPEESLVAGSKVADGISNSIPGPVADLAGYWNGSVGAVFRKVGEVFSKLPGVQQLGDLLANAIQPLLKLIMNQLIPNPFNEHQSGSRNFDLMTGGSDAYYNDACHNELGCERATNKQAADIVNKQKREARQEFDSKSFWARMFDRNDEHSLVGQVALALPSNVSSSAQTSFGSLLSNPMNKLLTGFSTIFTSNHAHADTPAQDDPFGITQYYYPTSEIPADPEAYWETHCKDGKQTAAWNDNLTMNPLTSTPENTTTNPCLLIKATGESAGQVF